MNDEELREEVAKFGEPKLLTGLDQKLLVDSLRDNEGNLDPFDLRYAEVGKAYGKSKDEMLSLPVPIFKSLAEKFDEANFSLKQREISKRLSFREPGIGSSTSRRSAKEAGKSE